MFWEIYVSLCVKNDISPNAVAKKIGISSGSVTNWKNGATPNSATLKKIADYFHVSADCFSDNNVSPIIAPVLGKVAAGVPISAIENIVDYEELDPKEFSPNNEYFGLVLKGDSMAPRMQDGDVVIVQSCPDVESGDIAIVMVENEEATCKKITKHPEGITLSGYNSSAYEPKFYTNKQILELPITILGKVVELRAKF